MAWYYSLKTDQAEFENLFDEPIRHLGTFLNFIENRVKFVFQFDDDGIKYAAWIEPWMSGAFLGFWSRADQRKGVGQIAFAHRVLQRALRAYSVIIGITRRSELHKIHLALGYKLMGEGIPKLFDGKTAFVYVLTQESYDVRKQHRFRIKHVIEPLRADDGAVHEGESADLQGFVEPNRGGPALGRSKRPDSPDKPKRGRKPRSKLNLNGKHEAGVSEGGIGG